jgi:hypothetical protein
MPQQIFSSTELVEYFGDDDDLISSSAKLDNLIQQALLIAESGEGANQPLEQCPQVELKAIPSSNQVRLASRFILPDTIAVSVRYPLPSVRLDNALFAAQWLAVDEDKWDYDPDTSELTLIIDPFRIIQPSRPTQRRRQNEAKITYTAGCDWTDTSPRIQRLKVALAGMVRMLGANTALSSGVKSYKLDDFYQIEYSDAGAQSAINQYLSVFKQLRAV